MLTCLASKCFANVVVDPQVFNSRLQYLHFALTLSSFIKCSHTELDILVIGLLVNILEKSVVIILINEAEKFKTQLDQLQKSNIY